MTSSCVVSADIRAVSPYRLCVVALICEYCEWRRRPQLSAAAVKRQRLDSCLLLLQLLHGAELSGSELLRSIEQTGVGEQLMAGLVSRLRRLHDAGLEGLAELVGGAELLIVEHGSCRAAVSCSSVVGFFVRAVILAYTRLSFHQIAVVFDNFSEYYLNSKLNDTTADKCERTSTVTDNSGGDSGGGGECVDIDCSVDMQDISDDVSEQHTTSQMPSTLHDCTAIATSTSGDIETEHTFLLSRSDPDCDTAVQSCQRRFSCDQHRHQQKQPPLQDGQCAQLLLSRQIELLQQNAADALPAQQVQLLCDHVESQHPAPLASTQFLRMLNCARYGEWSGAVHALYRSYDRAGAAAPGSGGGLREAALSLAVLHAHFGQRSAATAALREALTMARDGGDADCLRLVNSWLCTQLPDGQLRSVLLRRCAEHGFSADSAEGSLCVPAVVSYARVLSDNGGALMSLRYIDACCSDSQLGSAAVLSCRCAVMQRHGRPLLADMCSQLLLCRYSSTVPAFNGKCIIYSDDMYEESAGKSGGNCRYEAVLAASCAVAENLAGEGCYEIADSCLQWALGQSAAVDSKRVCSITRLKLLCQKQLLAGRWWKAEHSARQLVRLHRAAGQLCMVQVLLVGGLLPSAEKLVRQLLQQPAAEAETRIHQLALLSDIVAAAGDAAGACRPLLDAIVLCKRRRLHLARWSVLLRLAHALYQQGLVTQCLQLVRQLRHHVLTHGSACERARLHWLMALAEKKQRPQLAVHYLQLSAELLRQLSSWLMLRRVLSLQARLYHQLGSFELRNSTARQYTQLVTEYPSDVVGQHLQRLL